MITDYPAFLGQLTQRDINRKINADEAAQIANDISTGLHKDARSLLMLAYQLESNTRAITDALTEKNVDDTSK